MANGDDKVLSLLIQWGVLNQEVVEQARSEVRGLTEDTDELGQSMPENWQLFEKYKKVLGDTGKEALTAERATHLLHLTLKSMGADIPGLGILLRGLFNPITLGTAGGIAAEEVYFRWLEKREQKYRDLITLAQRVNDSIRAIFQAEKSGDEQFVEFTKAMAEAREHGRGLAADLENMAHFADAAREAAAAADDRMAQLHQTTADVQGRIVDLLEQMGKLSPGQSEQLKAQIEHAKKLKEIEDNRKKAVDDVSHRQLEVDQAKKVVSSYGSEDQLFKNRQKAEQQVARLEQTILDYQKIATDWKTAQDAVFADNKKGITISAEREKLLDDLARQKLSMDTTYQKAKEQLPSAEQEKIRTSKAYEEFQAAKETVKGFQLELDKAKNKLSEINTAAAPKIAEENQRFGLEAITGLLKNGQNIQQIFNDGVLALAGIQQAVQKWGETVPEIEARGKKALDDQTSLRPGQVLPQSEQRDIQRLEFIRAQQDHIKALNELFAAVGWNSQQVSATIALQVRGLSANTAILNATRNDLSAILIRLSDMESQLQKK